MVLSFPIQQLQPPPPQAGAPGQTDVVHVKGGTTYFNPVLQPPSHNRSPARRPKAAIPIVNPQVRNTSPKREIMGH